MITTAPLIRRFVLYNQGPKAQYEGVRFSNGWLVYRYVGEIGFGETVTDSLANPQEFFERRGYQFYWLDSEEPQRPACIHCGGGYLGGFCTDCGASGTVYTLPITLADDIVKWRRDSIELNKIKQKRKKKCKNS